MISETIILVCQLGLVAALAGWMISGVMDNWFYPNLNEEAVAQVMGLTQLEVEFPDDFQKVQHRRVTDRKVIKRAFYAIVAWETVAAIGLSIGTFSLFAALLGVMGPDTARGIAMLGGLAFILNWAGFLIGGNYFCYWYCHFGAQATHFLLVLWGVLTMIFLGLPL